MSENLVVESPNFTKIEDEAGQYTADAVRLLWAALNYEINTSRKGVRKAQESLEPKVKTVLTSSALDNYPTDGASAVLFTTGTYNVTGFLAPEPGHSRVLFLHNIGAGTITIKNNVTSVNENRILTESGADVALGARGGMILVYLDSRWRELA